MTDQSEQINPNGTIYALSEGSFGLPRLDIGTPYEIAVACPQAPSYYTADPKTLTMVRLAHVVVRRNAEESHQWFYWEATWTATDYIEPEERPEDPIAKLPDLEKGEEGDSFFGKLAEELDSEKKGATRGDLFATAVVALSGYQQQKHNLYIERIDQA